MRRRSLRILLRRVEIFIASPCPLSPTGMPSTRRRSGRIRSSETGFPPQREEKIWNYWASASKEASPAAPSCSSKSYIKASSKAL